MTDSNHSTRRGLLKCTAVGAVSMAVQRTIRAAMRSDNTVRFAVLGDVPYQQSDEALVRQVIKAAAGEAQFLIHVGDIKSGAESCDDALLSRRVKLFDESPAPIVMVPGDNEWTDCSRILTGRFDPLERLQALRRLLGSKSHALGGGRLPIERPGKNMAALGFPDPDLHPEYVRWQAGPCLFVTLNIPGSNNGLTAHIPDTFNRLRALRNRRWLLDSARVARQRGLAGLVIAMHADIQFRRVRLDDEHRDVLDRKNPYAWVRALLMQVAANFPGTVLMLNGDRHRFLNDHPFSDLPVKGSDRALWGVPSALGRARLERFTRVQSFGWPFTSHHVIVEASGSHSSGSADPVLQLTVATRILVDEPDR